MLGCKLEREFCLTGMLGGQLRREFGLTGDVRMFVNCNGEVSHSVKCNNFRFVHKEVINNCTPFIPFPIQADQNILHCKLYLSISALLIFLIFFN